jgi:hypothetical protein
MIENVIEIYFSFQQFSGTIPLVVPESHSCTLLWGKAIRQPFLKSGGQGWFRTRRACQLVPNFPAL